MNDTQGSLNSQTTGYLIVKVSTARGAIPLADAAVNIRGGSKNNSGVLFSLSTDSDGRTPKVSLPTPELYYSESPNNPIPYALYNIEVFKDGYVPTYFNNVPIFPSVISVQPAVMLPLSESGAPPSTSQINNETSTQETP